MTFFTTRPPALKVSPRAADGGEAEQVIARRARLEPPRARRDCRRARRRSSRARRCAEQRPKSRRLEGEHLVVRGQRRLDLGERRAGPRGQHQLRRLVGDDAGRGPTDRARSGRRPAGPDAALRCRRRRSRAAAPATIAAAHGLGSCRARFAARGCLRHRSEPRQVREAAARRGARASRPSSAQRCSVGKHLAGIEQRRRDRRRISRAAAASRSASLNIAGIRSRFSTPTPCSPVSTPPTSTQSRRMSAPNASARSSSPGLLAS